MAALDECDAAIGALAAKLAGVGSDSRAAMPQRTVSVRLADLDVTFRGELRDGTLQDIERCAGEGEHAQIRLTMSSDDLVALTDGTLGFGGAWAKGRLKVDAGPLDLIRLRALF